MSRRRVIALISGKVQGVWFRGSAQREARRLGVTGHARNLPDGRVEVLACGEASAVGEMLDWCHRGSDLAEVDGIEVRDEPGPPAVGFETG